MHIGAEPSDIDYSVLQEYLKAELSRADADERAVLLATEASFAQWAHQVLEAIAVKFGLTIGFLVGMALEGYRSIKNGFTEGFKAGLARGRGDSVR